MCPVSQWWLLKELGVLSQELGHLWWNKGSMSGKYEGKHSPVRKPHPRVNTPLAQNHTKPLSCVTRGSKILEVSWSESPNNLSSDPASAMYVTLDTSFSLALNHSISSKDSDSRLRMMDVSSLHDLWALAQVLEAKWRRGAWKELEHMASQPLLNVQNIQWVQQGQFLGGPPTLPRVGGDISASMRIS